MSRECAVAGPWVGAIQLCRTRSARRGQRVRVPGGEGSRERTTTQHTTQSGCRGMSGKDWRGPDKTGGPDSRAFEFTTGGRKVDRTHKILYLR